MVRPSHTICNGNLLEKLRKGGYDAYRHRCGFSSISVEMAGRFMIHNRIITENQLDAWVRSNAREAQGVIVELVSRLVAASSPKPRERRFPLGDSIGQPGEDGYLETDFPFLPFVPEGRSFWEIGTGVNPRDKATSDYRELTKAINEVTRRESTFIFVTPLSGTRDWKGPAQTKWRKERCQRDEWKDVLVIDGTGLIDWLQFFPAVEQWLAGKMGLPSLHIETPEHRWEELRNIGDPPPLIPDLFIANRDAACNKLKDILDGNAVWLKIDTHFRTQMADFVSAYIATLDDTAKADIVGRCLIVSSVDAWNAVTILRDRHILIADFDLNDSDSSGIRLLERAKKGGHPVIFGGMPGGVPGLNRISIPNPRNHQIKEALEKAGYKEGRARTLAQKSSGNLNSLLRCLQHLSLTPEWAQDTDAADLAIANLLGAWVEHSEADKVAVEKLSGNSYGEWIGTMRKIAFRPDTPLIQRDGSWKVVPRYEAWYALGPRVFDEHLDQLKAITVNVLREKDPQFELPANERYMANIRGKILPHSHVLRHGLAESLALLGSHPKALTSCTSGKAEATAILAVREILDGADWLLWASLNDLLPLLAEAAPREFLDAVETAVQSDPSPFNMVFAQEGNGLMGRNYMTGLLWALETLAWDASYLTRVVIILGELAARDPGGHWGNRPANSLSTILLPWYPQTCAPISKRRTALETLLNEIPDVAWKLLLDLLPSSHQVSSGSHKPSWREMIPDDWSEGVTNQEYWKQIIAYAELSISAAKLDLSRLAELIDRLDDLPSPVHDQLLAHLSSDAVTSMPQADRLPLWTKLVDLISRHRKFADAKWAMKPDEVDKIAVVAEGLVPEAPIYQHQRLFSERDFDLYEEKGNYEEQHKELEDRRKNAVQDVVTHGGLEAVLDFAQVVDSPWRVGNAYSAITEHDVEENILPALLESETKALAQFAAGFISGMFRRGGWHWVDNIDMAQWTSSQKGQLLAYLPFTADTWNRVAQLLPDAESAYWSKTHVNPYQAEEGLELAIDRLVQFNRPHEAIGCLDRLRYDKGSINSEQAVRVLQAVLDSPEVSHKLDVHAIVEVIKALQDDPTTNPDALFQVEWAFLPLLDGHHGAVPKLLEQRLADDPAFFCEVIRAVFRSRKEEILSEELTDKQKNIATNAYSLLNHWRTPPGTQKDGMYNGDTLMGWLEDVKTTCAESGHLEVALTTVGQVLIYTPPDPDGLWLHHAAARALNAKDADDMRDGFRVALFNARGVYEWTSGQAERELAKKYRNQAEAVETHGYYRLANTLRELADSYDREAEQHASRDSLQD